MARLESSLEFQSEFAGEFERRGLLSFTAVIEEPRGDHVEPLLRRPAEPEPEHESECEPSRQNTLKDKLKSTTDTVTVKRDESKKRYYRLGLCINGVVLFQGLFGCLISLIGTFPEPTRLIAFALGVFTLCLVLFLARLRALGEPEFTLNRTRELNSLLGDLQTFTVDHGNKTGAEYDQQIKTFEERLEAGGGE
ncbi:hypothetical protein BJ322DRAFT_1114799 [Thelephora terrestris]|uniref:SMODS and SLOG-associating 2TM effector domain-containing protein n=1 Tax=Thelephora terrestris TaxID=56493 RepID=A0A9P6L0X8_9AGAM|nr:hypothetical protein BJ322DRAFT_1114799 [Thelephora terrestris]